MISISSQYFFSLKYIMFIIIHTLWPPSSVFNNFPVVINTTQTTTSIITEANVIFNFPTIILVTHLHLEENYHLNHCYTIPTTMNNPATIFFKVPFRNPSLPFWSITDFFFSLVFTLIVKSVQLKLLLDSLQIDCLFIYQQHTAVIKAGLRLIYPHFVSNWPVYACRKHLPSS